jgi:hypothetical protein
MRDPTGPSTRAGTCGSGTTQRSAFRSGDCGAARGSPPTSSTCVLPSGTSANPAPGAKPSGFASQVPEPFLLSLFYPLEPRRRREEFFGKKTVLFHRIALRALVLIERRQNKVGPPWRILSIRSALRSIPIFFAQKRPPLSGASVVLVLKGVQ